ncbi:MAG: CapA family protein [Bacteroidales bacterium]|nr:CapA family protein [Bacteroidales bacterium]
MKKLNLTSILILISLIFTTCNSSGQNEKFENNEDSIVNTKPNEVSLLFLGDIMQHDLQIQSAYVPETGKYDFSSQFKHVKPIFDSTDIVIGNLEVTLAGKPYKGYPRFSSPDDLAWDIKKAGINYLVTANNHMYDRGKKGFERTMHMLDSVGFKRTGTFINEEDKKKNHPMIIEKNNFKIALFNYTYGLNGNVPEKPSIINGIKKDQIKNDLINATNSGYDAVIVCFHWGVEYKHQPNNEQISLADLCFENGADIVIGSHPHVIQKMEHKTYKTESGNEKDVLVAYSLGNFVSNYGTWRYCDGGTMIKFSLTKTDDDNLSIIDPEYHLIWVYREPKGNKLMNYYVLPVADFENNKDLKQSDKDQMNIFINDSRKLYDTENIGVSEYINSDVK